MGDEFWAQTQADLQGADDPLFSKPKLGENLLKKPPFRFLHDVVTGIQKSTGFAPGLFSEAESDAKAVASDKEAKALYLSKIIATVEAVLGEAVPAKPQKIMAGLEPENTNVFLQQLARAARSCRSTDQGAAAVAQVMSGGGGGGGGGDGGQEAPPPAPAPPPAAAEEEPPPRAAPEPEAQDLPPPPPPPAPAMEEPAAPPAAAQPDVGGGGEEATAERKHSSRSGRSRGESRESREGSRSRERDSRSRERDSRSREGKDKERRERKERKKREEAGAEAEAAGAGAGPDSMERPPSGQQRPGAIMRGVERPQSARRGPPRSGSRPQSDGPKGDRNLVPTEGPKVFVEGDNDDDDDEVEVVTESVPDFAPSGMGDSLSGDGQGALVKDILSAQKQLAKGAEGAAETEEEAAPASTGIVLKRRGSSKNVAQPAGAKGATDLGKLRESIQALCQSTMPLGKSMDYLQEDLENMKKELKFWMNEHRVYQEKLTEQQRYTEELLNPQAALADLENQMRQAKDRIRGMKAQVLRNDETIGKLLAMVVSGAK